MNKYFVIIIVNIIFHIEIVFAGEIITGTCDTLIHFSPGNGQNLGQSPQFFPNNIFGLPSKIATETIPETSENEICSLGLNGEIIVGFKNIEIVDGPGPDFTIFENAFINPLNNKIFAEPGIVSVSNDGITYITFPFDSLTLQGCAGTKPTNGNKDPFNPNESGGNSFDLVTLGLQSIKYIKIRDITNIVLNNKTHPFYDPTLTGFDLDAVVAINYQPKDDTSIQPIDETNFKLYSKNQNIIIQNDFFNNYIVNIYNLNGVEVFNGKISSSIYQIPINFPFGIYFIKLSFNGNIYYQKLLIQ